MTVAEACGLTWIDECTPGGEILHGINELTSLSDEGEVIGGQPGAWSNNAIAADWHQVSINLDRGEVGPRSYLVRYAAIDGAWNWSFVDCTLEIVEHIEDRCDGIDDDRDGQVDEDFAPTPVQCGVGACVAAGQTACINGVVVDACEPGAPAVERCGTGVDEDCDGEIDDGFDLGADCTSGVGACAVTGLTICAADSLGAICDAVPNSPSTEQCSGFDEDCDGEIDEDFDAGGPCAVGVGTCSGQGVFVCAPDGQSAVCDAVPSAPGDELCGTGADEDCDGQVDEGFPPGEPCPGPQDCTNDVWLPTVDVARPVVTLELVDRDEWQRLVVAEACEMAWNDACTAPTDFVHGIAELTSPTGADIGGEPGAYVGDGVRADWHWIDVWLDRRAIGPRTYRIDYASEPMTNYLTDGDGRGTDWRGDVAVKWGAMADNLPTDFVGPADWADHLSPYAGTGVWDWQNHQANFDARQADEMAPFGLGHGYADFTIEWSTQGRAAYPVFDRARHAWGGYVGPDDHHWLAFAGLPPTLATDASSTPFNGWGVVRGETVPGLSAFSGHDHILPPEPPRASLVGPGPGGFNQTLDWSASWNAWDGPPTDEIDVWQMSLRTTDASPQTVDVTPRRLQRFAVTPGVDYTWENTSVSDGTLVASGIVAADADGLLTVPAFAISGGGNRLRIARP